MARHLFGSVADYVVAAGDEATSGSITGYQTLLVPGADVTFWSAATGGAQYTDLLDLTDVAIAGGVVTTDSAGALPQFKGPDGVTVMYADTGGPRRAIVATDIGDVLPTVDGLASDVVALEATVGGLAAVATSGAYADLSGTPALADVATSGAYADLDGTPPVGVQYVVKVGGVWPLRAATAPDAASPAMWIGPAPAPPSGSGYAAEGDVWVASP